MRITIKNLNKRYKINEPFVKKLILNILKILKKPLSTELEVIFLSDGSIKKLNKEYKRRDRPTDVLCFRIDKREFSPGAFVGEIFISLDTARRNSKVFRKSYTEEITLYLIHAILHIFGYEDESINDRLRMSRKEERILERLCGMSDLSKVLTPR